MIYLKHMQEQNPIQNFNNPINNQNVNPTNIFFTTRMKILLSIFALTSIFSFVYFFTGFNDEPSQLETKKQFGWTIKGNDIYNDGKQILGVDSKSFEVLEDTQSFFEVKVGYDYNITNEKMFTDFPYAKDKFNVYYKNSIVAGADKNTFTVLFKDYAKDKNHIYYYGKVLNTKLDPETFSLVYSSLIVKDKNGAYILQGQDHYVSNSDNYKYDRLSNIKDPQSLNFVSYCKGMGVGSGEDSNHNYYFKDKNNIYYIKINEWDNKYSVNVLDGIDVNSFQFLWYATYTQEEEMAQMDYRLFNELTAYAKDDKNVYFGCGNKIEGADRKTFMYMKDFYSKDKNNIWYKDKIIKNADLKTFEAIGHGYATDKNYRYKYGVVFKNIEY